MNFKTISQNILLVFIIVISFACNKENDLLRSESKTQHLANYHKLGEYNNAIIKFTANEINKYLDEKIKFIEELSNSIEVYKIEYYTTFQNEKILASGVVFLPKVNKKFPILSYQNGTNTEHKKAPSENFESPIFKLLNLTASTGFITVIPDYLGFGSSSHIYHPYLHEESTTQSMVDMLKAVKEFVNGTNVEAIASDDLYLAGYSQGGWSTMILQKELETNQDNQFNILASSCGAGPYSLEVVIKNVLKRKEYNNPYFIGYVFNTIYQMGIVDQNYLQKVVKEPYASNIDGLFNGVNSGNQINEKLTTKISDLLTENFIKNYETAEEFKVIRDWLRTNSIDFAWKTKIPTKLFHGTEDSDVPFETSEEAYNLMIKNNPNANIELLPLEGSNHIEGFLPSQLRTLEWFIGIKNK